MRQELSRPPSPSTVEHNTINNLNLNPSSELGQDLGVLPSQYPTHPTISSITLENSKSFAHKLACCGTLNLSAYALMRDMLDFMSKKEEVVIEAYTNTLISMNHELDPAISRVRATNTLKELDAFVFEKNLELGESVQASLLKVKHELRFPNASKVTLEERIIANSTTIKSICTHLELLGANPQKVSEFQSSFFFNTDHSPQRYDAFTKLINEFNTFLHTNKIKRVELIRSLTSFSVKFKELDFLGSHIVHDRLREVQYSMFNPKDITGDNLTKWNPNVGFLFWIILLTGVVVVSCSVKAVAFWTYPKSFSITLACILGPTLLRRNNLPGFIAKLYYHIVFRFKNSKAMERHEEVLKKVSREERSLWDFRKQILSKSGKVFYVDQFVCFVWSTYYPIKENSRESRSIKEFFEKLFLKLASLENIEDMYNHLDGLKIESSIPRSDELRNAVSELLDSLCRGNFELKTVRQAIRDNKLNYSITAIFVGAFFAAIAMSFKFTEDTTWGATVFFGALGGICGCYAPFTSRVPEWEELNFKKKWDDFQEKLMSPLSSSSISGRGSMV
ncbi:hypothetical protein FDK38_004954 [Candidozyma auris]|nr:hypothetical protein FDK38_004954 [[Candida] auris]